jgi:thymidylate synthase
MSEYTIRHKGNGEFEAIMDSGEIREVGPNIKGMIRYTFFPDFSLPPINYKVTQKELLEAYQPKVMKDISEGKINIGKHEFGETDWIEVKQYKVMNNIDKQYTDLLQDILDNGYKKDTRNGKVLSVFGRTIRHSMKDGFPLLTTKKMYFKGIVTELLWFLKGDTNIKYLLDNDCHIWDGDAWMNYSKCWEINPMTTIGKLVGELPFAKMVKFTQEEFINKIKTDDDFAKKWGELGPIYGKQWRSWGRVIYNHEHRGGFYNPIDQIANLINELKTNPDSRRMMVSAWNVGELDQMVLPPCHYGFQVYTRELTWDERHELAEKVYQIDDTDDVLDKEGVPTRAISLMWNQRSVDTPLGLPYNIASYALLLSIIAKQVNMIPEEVIGNLVDCHIYTNQIEGVKEQLTREPYELPTVKISDRAVTDISEYTLTDIVLENYQSHPTIKMPLSN